jgi:hypothetical protein
MSIVPTRSEGRVSLLDEERAQAYDRTETVWGLIERQAQAHPERTAIVDGETEIDYARLTERASAIAGELVARGVAPGSLVGVCMSRTWELVATLVGVLRAGCAYVPLDPAYPRERVRYMLEHARAAGAIVDHEERAELCRGVPELVRLDEVGEWTADGVAGPSARDLAYVIYTSGSTGRPKGVAVEHRSVVGDEPVDAHVAGRRGAGRGAGGASVCFDPRSWRSWVRCRSAGRWCWRRTCWRWLELPSADRVRTCIMVPSAMQALLAAGRPPEGLRCLVLGGEVLKRSLVDQLHALEPRRGWSTCMGRPRTRSIRRPRFLSEWRRSRSASRCRAPVVRPERFHAAGSRRGARRAVPGGRPARARIPARRGAHEGAVHRGGSERADCGGAAVQDGRSVPVEGRRRDRVPRPGRPTGQDPRLPGGARGDRVGAGVDPGRGRRGGGGGGGGRRPEDARGVRGEPGRGGDERGGASVPGGAPAQVHAAPGRDAPRGAAPACPTASSTASGSRNRRCVAPTSPATPGAWSTVWRVFRRTSGMRPCSRSSGARSHLSFVFVIPSRCRRTARWTTSASTR